MPDSQFTGWLRAARAGHGSALGQLLESFRQYLALVAQRALGKDLRGKLSGSDLVQQTFLDAQNAWPQFAGTTPAELLAWLERILLHNVADTGRRYRQRGKRRLSLEVPFADAAAGAAALVDPSTPSANAVAREEAERLGRALQRLSPLNQRVILLRNYEKRSFEDIGNHLGRSTAAAKKLWARAVVKLSRELKKP
jgi:RNA polymerase sigma-70 factor (ECF subfamily)